MEADKVREAWRCYVCGEPIGEQFILFSLNVETDRVFLAHKKCQARLDAEAVLIGVQREVAALADTPTPSDSSIVKTLRAHWLRAVVCHHALIPGDKAWDRAECACSEVNLPQMDTIGEAVETWIQHVRVVAAIEYPAAPTEPAGGKERPDEHK